MGLVVDVFYLTDNQVLYKIINNLIIMEGGVNRVSTELKNGTLKWLH
jgi:hypothetical protein